MQRGVPRTTPDLSKQKKGDRSEGRFIPSKREKERKRINGAACVPWCSQKDPGTSGFHLRGFKKKKKNRPTLKKKGGGQRRYPGAPSSKKKEKRRLKDRPERNFYLGQRKAFEKKAGPPRDPHPEKTVRHKNWEKKQKAGGLLQCSAGPKRERKISTKKDCWPRRKKKKRLPQHVQRGGETNNRHEKKERKTAVRIVRKKKKGGYGPLCAGGVVRREKGDRRPYLFAGWEGKYVAAFQRKTGPPNVFPPKWKKKKKKKEGGSEIWRELSSLEKRLGGKKKKEILRF